MSLFCSDQVRCTCLIRECSSRGTHAIAHARCRVSSLTPWTTTHSQRLTVYNPGVTRSRTQTSETCSRSQSSHPIPNHNQSANVDPTPQNRQPQCQSQHFPHQSRRQPSMSAQIRQQRGGGWTLEALRPRSHSHIRQPSLRDSQAPRPGDLNDCFKTPPKMIITTLRMPPPRQTSMRPYQNPHLQVVRRPAAHRPPDLQHHCQRLAVCQHTPRPCP